MKKIFALLGALSCVFMLGAVAFAETSTGVSGFATEITTALSAENIWSAIIPLVPLIAVVTLVAVARRVANKNMDKLGKGKSGRVA